jgi:hypothetical protein
MTSIERPTCNDGSPEYQTRRQVSGRTRPEEIRVEKRPAPLKELLILNDIKKDNVQALPPTAAQLGEGITGRSIIVKDVDTVICWEF